MKHSHNKHRRDVAFAMGDFEWLKLQPYRQKSLSKRKFIKLATRFFGPYEVIRKIGQVAYKLALPADAKLHPLFHVSLLKHVVGTSPPTAPAPLPISAEGELLLCPERIIDHRWGNTDQLPLLVKWAVRPPEESSWEDYDSLQTQFPDFRLGDKSIFEGGRCDTPLLTYHHRRFTQA
ncbi:hypothetical protein LINPERHAP2_LOCUS23163 [Linum perenne]